MIPSSLRDRRTLPWIIFVSGLLVRLLWLWVEDEAPLSGDAADYWATARAWASGQWAGAYWPPGLPAWLALWRLALGGSYLVPIAASLAVWSGFYWTFAHLSQRRSLPHRPVLLALWAFYPAFIYQSLAPLSYLPGAWLLLLAWEGKPTRGVPPWRALTGGLVLGAMGLLRPALLSVAPVVAWRGLGFVRPDRRLRAGGWLLLGLLLSLGPWLYLVQQQTNGWLGLSQASSYNFFLGNQPETPHYRTWWLGSHTLTDDPALTSYYQRLDSLRALPVAKQPAAFRSLAWQHLRQEPGLFLLRAWHRLRVFWAFDTLAGAELIGRGQAVGWAVLALDALGYLALMGLILAGAWYASRRRLGIGLLLTAAYLLPYLLAFSHPTYHPGLLPLLALGSASPRKAWLRLRRDPSWRGWGLRLSLLLLWLIQVEWVWRTAGVGG